MSYAGPTALALRGARGVDARSSVLIHGHKGQC
jgi:hypothetical protein